MPYNNQRGRGPSNMVHRNSDSNVNPIQPHTIMANHFAVESNRTDNTASSNSFSNASPPVNHGTYLRNTTGGHEHRSDHQRLPNMNSFLESNQSNNTKPSDLSKISNASGSIIG